MTAGKLYFAACARGLGEFLASELNSMSVMLRHVQAQVEHMGSSSVLFLADTATGYRPYLWLRTATQVLEHTSTLDTGDLYAAMCNCGVQWDEVIGRHGAFDVQMLSQNEKLQMVQGHDERLAVGCGWYEAN